MDRRHFITSAATLTAGSAVNFTTNFASAQERLLNHVITNSAASEKSPDKAGNLSLASFTFDVTPPKGHSLCGGWI